MAHLAGGKRQESELQTDVIDGQKEQAGFGMEIANPMLESLLQMSKRKEIPAAPTSPFLYEINTRCWLRELSERRGQPITLGTVPIDEVMRLQELGFTHLWLMGVWSTGPRGRAHALNDPELRATYAKILPDFSDEDIPGSPYAITAYEVPPALGGEAGLSAFRELLHRHGMKLVLDFVPNHVGLDHPWVTERPELFVQSREDSPETFPQESPGEILWLGHGKDPFFPAWIDTAQLDYRRADTQAAMQGVLESVAERCDGVRCDMAMLVLREIFAKNWSQFPCAGKVARNEFWKEAIEAVTAKHPGFLFLAEVYWNLETQIKQVGFHYTYDKRLLDLLLYHRQETLCYLASAGDAFLTHSAHFLENHDEPRIAGRMSLAEHRAAALVAFGLPGLKLVHEGQLTGARLFTPVHFGRRPLEPFQVEIIAFYEHLFRALAASAVGKVRFRLLKPGPAWPENPTAQNFILLQWQTAGPAFELVVVNLAPHPSQCRVVLELPQTGHPEWRLRNLLGDEEYLRRGGEMSSVGLFLDLPAHGAQLLHCTPSED
jgi:hypothetical protein